MGQLKKLGPKENTPLGLADESHKKYATGETKLSDQTAPVRSNNDVIHKQKGLDQETHEALLQLITELEELLEE